ncbi:TIGR02391 family protein [Neisseria dentiae]|uniref:TIGR02391 family protein n=1 Tax=Neisseria dentiae TaxID=194197 RepID=UPI0035A0C25B
MSEENLQMSFEPTVIEHLGVKMYSHTVPAIAELIANAYDACATEVEVNLFDKPEHKIVIKDNGVGMSFDEINDFYLRIGRNRRKEQQASPCGRNPTGKKGLGKLALFGLGNKIEISTTQGNERVTFILDYAEILKSKGIYQPEFRREPVESASGTTITLTELTKKQGYPLDNYVEHLSRLFDFPAKDFRIQVSLNGSEPRIIDGNSKYGFLIPEFEWKYQDLATDIPSLSSKFEQYESSGLIQGKFITTEKPLKNNMKGITLFANGRMVNMPEFFTDSESSHFYSYLTGWLNVDFIDDDDEDLIATDRTSLDWKHPKTSTLRVFLGEIVRAIGQDWRRKRKEEKDKEIKGKNGIDQEAWKSKLPEKEKQQVGVILDHLEESELTSKEQATVISALHSIVPEYPYYHWRHLHQDLHNACNDFYNEKKDYLSAAIEAVKIFEDKVQKQTGLHSIDGKKLFETAFGSNSSILLLTNNETQTEKNLEDGLGQLACGTWTGFRNPVQHELRTNLYPGIFTDKDALDLISLISYLLRKVEQTKKRPKQAPSK